MVRFNEKLVLTRGEKEEKERREKGKRKYKV